MASEDELSALLGEFARTLLTDFSLDTVLHRLVGRIVHMLDVTGAGITLISSDQVPQVVTASDDKAHLLERLQAECRQGPCLTAYTSGTAVQIPDLSSEAGYPEFRPAAVAAGLAAVFTFPLWHGNRCLGALDLYRNSPGNLPQHERAVAQTVADVASGYLVNARRDSSPGSASAAVRDLSLRDPLTGLPSRMLLEERLDHAAARACRSGSTATLLLAALHCLRRVDDGYGSTVGEQLLQAAATRLSMQVRPGDTLARLDGAEFAILCEDLAGLCDPRMLAARIHEAFAEPFLVGDTELLVTASVGLLYSGPAEGLSSQLIADAAAAASLGKRRGAGARHVIDLRAAGPADRRSPAGSISGTATPV